MNWTIFKEKFQLITAVIKKDTVFSISLILALLSCFIARPEIEYIDFKVLACLFELMVVVKAFEELQILDRFAISIINRCTDSRKVSLVLIMLSFLSSMLITNDIALITLVPLTLIISKKSNVNVMLTVIFETLAANIGSSLTPMGNPQNLYIFSYYNLSASQFFTTIILFSGLGLIWLYIINFKTPKIRLNTDLKQTQIKDKLKAAVWTVLFCIVVLSVFEVVSYMSALIMIVLAALFINKKLFKEVDYFLLITFVCFFIFIGNISSIPAIVSFMELHINTSRATYLYSILLSQIISNVPCAIFLSKFTNHWRELLLGVNIGGMGTIIASLASVISYKLYLKANPDSSKSYMLNFSIYNVISLVLFLTVNLLLIQD